MENNYVPVDWGNYKKEQNEETKMDSNLNKIDIQEEFIKNNIKNRGIFDRCKINGNYNWNMTGKRK